MSSRILRLVLVAMPLSIFVGIMIFIVWYNAEIGCRCTNKEPVHYKTVPNIKTDDSRSLANFLGYFKYLQQDEDNYTIRETYLPLQLKWLNVEVKSDNEMSYRLEADCATLNIELRKTRAEWIMAQITVVPGLSDTSSPFYQFCTIVEDIQFAYPIDRHYSCHIPKSYSCKENSNSGGNRTILYIEHLEFELDGDPEMISMGFFSTTGFGCTQLANSSIIDPIKPPRI